MSDQEPAAPQAPRGAGKKTAVGVAAVVLALAGAVTVAVRSGDVGSSPQGTLDAGRSEAGTTVSVAGKSDRRIDFRKICQGSSGSTVPTGSASEADSYYAAMSQEIGLQQFDTLDAVLSYLGYHITAKALQDTLPATLMDPAASQLTAGAVLAARFFAPKITDVSSENTPPKDVGWRKLVRVRTAQGSAARTNGIDAAFVLFNFFSPIQSTTPFEGADSANTQVMLVNVTPGHSPIYWLDYGKTSEGAPLSRELDAFFDAGHTPNTAGKRSYFVPCGCIACHGGLQLDRAVVPPAPTWDPDKALLNYLDTDHWFDRTQKGEDFANLASAVISDAGGADVIRTLNGEIRDQNRAVQPGSMQEQAASHWLELHAASTDYISDLSQRALSGAGGVRWNRDDPGEMAALKSFNHYCFRCHGSVEFDVLDKSMVLQLRTLLLARLQARGALADPRATMPPDRDMKDADRVALRAFVSAH